MTLFLTVVGPGFFYGNAREVAECSIYTVKMHRSLAGERGTAPSIAPPQAKVLSSLVNWLNANKRAGTLSTVGLRTQLKQRQKPKSPTHLKLKPFPINRRAPSMLHLQRHQSR